MIQFPSGNLVLTKYPGYYWDVVEKELYTIKGSGTLKKMKRVKAGSFGRYTWKAGYRISHEGIPRKYTLEQLNKLKADTFTTTIPYADGRKLEWPNK